MTFRIALSGLHAASTELNVTANNIANVNTIGFKKSRAEFGDLFANSLRATAANQVGSGVKTQRVAQQFAQGSIDFTDNALDMAISGEGFFTLSNNGVTQYSRAGAFSVDRNGYVVNSQGARLQSYPPITGGGFNTGTLADLQLTTTDSPPLATSKIEVGNNLPANEKVPTVATFDPTVANSYSRTTSLQIYDSQGIPHSASLYYVKTANPNEWQLHTVVDGTEVGTAQTLTFDANGALTSPAGGQIALSAITFPPPNGAAPLNVTLDIAKTTQYGNTWNVNQLRQDGYTTGRLAGIAVDDEGVVQARYTNGQSTPLGQVVLSNFPNAQGLSQIGDTNWVETYVSGQPIRGSAGTSSFGDIQAGALEASNVDMTEQLVTMITAQRNFQANAQMITTADQITQTVINIR